MRVTWDAIARAETNIATYRRISFTGKSGQKYYFHAWPLQTRFKALGAVFFVTKRSLENKTYLRSANHEGIFIGKTSNLGEPLATQGQLDRFTKHGANCICVHLVENEERRLAAEQDLIAGNTTACN